jgi:molybdenum cofactor cytidylyltransferase
MKFGEIAVGDALGAILAHSVSHRDGVFKKGRVIGPQDVALLEASGVERVFAARLDVDDVPEDEAAAAVAQAIAGAGIEAQEPFTGRANLHARSPGVAMIDADRVLALNRLHESLTLATVAPFETVARRQLLATVKVIPFAVPRPILEQALKLIGGSPLIALKPFEARRAGLVITSLPQTKASIVRKSESAMRERLQALGSTLGDVVLCRHDTAEVAAAIARLKAGGHDPVLVFGASAIVDRGDVVPAGLTSAGGTVVHLGMPVDPGNLMMLGRLGDTPVIGVPSCARSPKVNGFDWVLARILAGIAVTGQDIMDMGAGGLLKEIMSRPTPRDNAGGVPAAPTVAAVLLAAGASRRMGGPNKLLARIGSGAPMVRVTAEALVEAGVQPMIVVTGRDAGAVEQALQGLDVRFVQNADYESGLASSLRAGVAAVPEDAAGVLVALGDMPLVGAKVVRRLAAGFNPAEGRLICVPVHQGRRGNPVLFSRRFLQELMALTGDEGARSLLARHPEDVAEIEAGSTTIFADFDTPESLAALRGE